MVDTAVVPVKSPLLSKINWTQVVAAGAAILVVFGVDIDARTQAELCAGIVALQAAVTVIIKTWFTSSITPQSLPFSGS